MKEKKITQSRSGTPGGKSSVGMATELQRRITRLLHKHQRGELLSLLYTYSMDVKGTRALVMFRERGGVGGGKGTMTRGVRQEFTTPMG